jgi:hypothetical protein
MPPTTTTLRSLSQKCDGFRWQALVGARVDQRENLAAGARATPEVSLGFVPESRCVAQGLS